MPGQESGPCQFSSSGEGFFSWMEDGSQSKMCIYFGSIFSSKPGHKFQIIPTLVGMAMEFGPYFLCVVVRNLSIMKQVESDYGY